jgi:hypothetical protein
MEMEKNKKSGLEASFKSMDTEEWLDIHFYRPVGYQWALFFHKLGVTPNAITVASIFLGVGAAVCFAYPDWKVNLVGIFLLIWANSYDSADGQLARMTNQKSELGRILDGVCGDIWFVAIYTAICMRLTPEWGIYIWLLGAVTGFFHSKQAAMADYYRNIHLLFLKGKAGSELAHAVSVRELYHSISFRKEPIRKVFQWFYKNYTANQEQLSPRFQKFYAVVQQKYGDSIPDVLRAEFRKRSKPLMKYTNILTFNTRSLVLFISLLINEPWIYFTFELTVLNMLFVYMIYSHEKLCSDLTKQINEP